MGNWGHGVQEKGNSSGGGEAKGMTTGGVKGGEVVKQREGGGGA